MKNNRIIIISVVLMILFCIVVFANICYAMYTKDWTRGIFFVLLFGLVPGNNSRK